MRDHLFHLDSSVQGSLQSQIRIMLIKAITEGHIEADTPVPSCRELARQLCVSRNTVMLSYERLVEDGFLYTRERSGYFVSPEFQPSPIYQAASAASTSSQNRVDWSRRLCTRPSQWRNIVKPDNWRAYPYPFIYGQLDDALFPFNAWRECMRDANSRQAVRDWAMDSFDGDDPLLIEQLRTGILPVRGVWAGSEEILITMGAQNSLYLISRLLMSPNIVVGIEEPGYVDARNIFEISGARVVPIPLDNEGLIVDERLEACDIVYTTPSHQSPTTVTMSLERRRLLLRKARECGIVVIEDDYDSDANFLHDPIPALKSLDRDGRVIYISSLSKTLAPGLRVGYITAPRQLVEEMRRLRRLILRHPPSNNQRTVGLFIAHGHHDTLRHRLMEHYRERWDIMSRALQRHAPQLQYTPVHGGTSFWVRLPWGMNGEQLVQQAAYHGVLIESGEIHFKSEQHIWQAPDYIRLAFSAISAEKIRPGIQCLGEALSELVENEPPVPGSALTMTHSRKRCGCRKQRPG